MLRIATFGRLEFSRDGFTPVRPTRGKPAALLAFLLVEGRRVSRETLAELLWPGLGPDAARLNLRQALFVLRRQLGALQAQRLIVVTATHLAIDPAVAHQSDWALLHAHAAATGADLDDTALREIDTVVAQAAAPFLDGFKFKASAEFERWLHAQRSAAQQTLLRLLGCLADARERRGEFDAAVRVAERALALDPADETAQQRLMQLQLQLRSRSATADRRDTDRGEVGPQRLYLTVLASRLPPPTVADTAEAALAERRTLAAELQRIVAEHGGFWVQAHGAEFFAYFGYPLPGERSALQAVRAACALRQHCASLAQALRRDLVVSDPRGAAPDELGALSAQAAALLRDVEPGGIVLGAGVAERAAPLWALHRVDAAAGALPCFRLGAPRPQTAAPRTPFVGRDAERTLLLRAWRDAQRGSARALLLHGEAGIGKSRLVDVFADSQQLPCLRVVFDGSAPARGALPLLGALAGVQHGDDDAQREQVIARQLGPEHVAQRQRLTALLLHERGAELHRAGISPLAQRSELLELAQLLLRRRCRDGALLLVVDDVHQANAATQSLLQALLAGAAAAGLPLLALLTARTPWPTDWPGLQSIELQPLPDADIARMLAALGGAAQATASAGAEAHDAGRRAWLLERSAGNPLFAEELVALRGPAQASARIADLLGTRLAQLGDACASAQHAAVIGLHFDADVLGRVSPLSNATVERHLAQLRAAGIVHPIGDGRLAFRHALLRDTAYAMLGAAERMALHRRVALALDDAGGSARAAARAEHWEQAQAPKRAAAAWLDAGADALKRHVYATAAACYARGLDALQQLDAGAQRDMLELRLRLGAARAGQRSGNFHDPAAMRHLERALQLAGMRGADPAELFDSLWGAWEVSACQVSFHYGLSLAGKLLEVAGELDAEPYAVLARYALGVSRYWTGNFERARADLQAVIAADARSAEPLRNPYGLLLAVGAHAYAALCCQRLGLDAAAASHGRRAWVAAHRADDDYAWVFTCTLGAIRERMAQRPARVRACARAGLERAARSRLVTFEAVLRSHAAWADVLERRDVRALQVLERGVRTVELDYPAAMVVQLIPQVEALHLLGRDAAALKALRALLQWRERLYDQRDDDSVERLVRSCAARR